MAAQWRNYVDIVSTIAFSVFACIKNVRARNVDNFSGVQIKICLNEKIEKTVHYKYGQFVLLRLSSFQEKQRIR